jgi:hypothetical protein
MHRYQVHQVVGPTAPRATGHYSYRLMGRDLLSNLARTQKGTQSYKAKGTLSNLSVPHTSSAVSCD